MKTLRLLLSLAVVTAVFAVASQADNFVTKHIYQPNTIVTDTVRWRSSGLIPGTGPLKVDTMVAATLNDTSLPIDIWGAKQVSVTVLTRGKNDDSDVTFYAQVGAQTDTLGPWHQLNIAYSVDNTAGTEVGGADDTAKDTTLWMLLNNTVPDTNYTVQTGMVLVTHGDMAYVRSSNYLRFWWDPDTSSGDTNYITMIYTIVR